MKTIVDWWWKPVIRWLVIAAMALLLISCATQAYQSDHNPSGFFSDLLHSFLIFFSFIASIFAAYRIYAFPSSGGCYAFG